MAYTIIIPIHNEESNIPDLLKGVEPYSSKHEIFIVDDGSIDGSFELLSNCPFIKLERIKQNSGKGTAIRRGLDDAAFDKVIIFDGDMELDPAEISKLMILDNNSGLVCVFGSRYLSGKLKRNNSFINKFVGKFNSFIFNILFSESLSDVHCGAKIISREVIKKINLTIKDFGFEIDLASQIAKNGFNIFEYGISYFSRSTKEGKKITWIDGFKAYYYLFKTRFIDNDISTKFSILFSTVYMIYIGSHFSKGTGSLLIILITFIIGLFIGLKRKIVSSSLIYLFCFVGSLFSKGNGRVYTVILGFFIGLYLSKEVARLIRKKTKNKFIHFFV